MLADPRLTPSRSAAGEHLRAECPQHADDGASEVRGSLARADGPEYVRLRGLFGRAFSPSLVARLRDSVTESAHRLIDDFAGRGGAELVGDYIEPLAVEGTLDLLGIPIRDRPDASRATLADLASTEGARAYCEGLRDHRGPRNINRGDSPKGHEAGPGLLRTLAELRVDGDQLTAHELHAALLLLQGTCRTVTAVVSGALWHALSDRATYKDVSARTTDGELSVTTVNELLRFTSAGEGTIVRFATEQLAVAGRTIEAGDVVLLDLAAANRDGSVFNEPGEICPDRARNPHLAFGQGPHSCLGAALARTEISIAMGALFSRCENLRPAGERDAVTWQDGWSGAWPTKLMVSFD